MSLDWYIHLDLHNKNPKIKRVIFVCKGNTCRSPSAEYYFKKRVSGFWSGITCSSRGIIDSQRLEAVPEIKKVIGDRLSTILENHRSRKITHSDIQRADLVLALDKEVRDIIKRLYPSENYKVFTLKGFVNGTEGSMLVDLDVPNPFIPIAKRQAEDIIPGTVKYYRYLQNYKSILESIDLLIRRLIEIIYRLNRTK
ncbi:hypothetical protein HYW21_01245 [Candidatus Woesearchaeota archaeon]|nr:hypothetical protein [Candidatus Woesearchaeota archaeon]